MLTAAIKRQHSSVLHLLGHCYLHSYLTNPANLARNLAGAGFGRIS